jgi:hypothetical protein
MNGFAHPSGVQRAQPVLATRRRWVGSWTTAAAPLTPAAPISEPPNQAARPRSCRVRARVLSVDVIRIVPFTVIVQERASSGPAVGGTARRGTVRSAGHRAMATPATALTRCRPLSAPLRDKKLMSLLPAANSPYRNARP